MDLRLLITVLSALGAPSLSVPDGSLCPKPSGETSSCVCQTSKGVVDLRSVANDNGVARYKGMQDENNYLYEYNPCYPFSTVGECSDVHLCQESQLIPPETYKIAAAGTEQMYLDSSGAEPKVTVFYTSQNDFGQSREVYVELTCDKDVKEPLVTTTGDSKVIFTYEVAFKSCHACPGGCGGGGGGSAAGIIGLVLMILLIVGLVAYFIIGSVINNVHFQKRGIEMIPQKNFWFALPGLIKEGFIFTFKPIVDLVKNRGSGGGKGSYQNL